ncbi:hypothetical protein FUAX_46160 (plasmid) [Fulvitalea axinellae]|uniref:GyrI-like small molecule binding domain-containing protein n=1 Tax=Fulvitalea axinellae TaxID=1182444 RepID=A0AAU9DCI0_9BACT|nr:hypothetical protein FUAX_46160 [Fulvitalea axinellae]
MDVATKTFELAYYQIKAESKESYLKNYAKFVSEIGKSGGFEGLETYKNIDNELEILDYAVWESPEDARKADERVQSDEVFGELMEPIDQILMFENVGLDDFYESDFGGEAGFLELNVYTVDGSQDAEFREVRERFYEKALADSHGMISVACYRSGKDSKTCIDVLLWDKKESADAAHGHLGDSLVFKTFQASVKEMKLFKRFKPLFENEKLDFFKSDKNYYQAGDTVCEVILPSVSYLTIEGQSSPENDLFQNAIRSIQASAYSVKRKCQETGSDFVIPKLEALWWVDSEKDFEETPMDEWHWKLLLRMPDFASEDLIQQAVSELSDEKGWENLCLLKTETRDGGKCLQVMHIGPYEEESVSIKKIVDYAEQSGLTIKPPHHEIYVSDPRKTPEARLKTIIRYFVD